MEKFTRRPNESYMTSIDASTTCCSQTDREWTQKSTFKVAWPSPTFRIGAVNGALSCQRLSADDKAYDDAVKKGVMQM